MFGDAMLEAYVPRLSRKEMERRRLAAGRELLGKKADERGFQARIAKKYQVTRPTVSKWRKAVREGGLDALCGSTSSGRPPKLTGKQKHRLASLLVPGARSHGYENDVWTGKRVAALIKKEFGVEYEEKYMPQFLYEQLGFSWQKPMRRPRELDPEKVREWLESKWEPAKKGRSRNGGASSSSTNPASS